MPTPLQVLQTYWGYDQFRSLQSDVIDSVLNGVDSVALLHTGAGKSVCYQVPAMVLPGKTLVISPLIALMQDQVESLTKKGIFAKAIFSGMSRHDVDLTLDNFMNGPLKILYVSPERLQNITFIERFKKTKISLIAVDESHCISQWGHDFRPAYHDIHLLRQWHPKVPVLAVTATATSKVVDDIVAKLELQDPNIYKATFERENLAFGVTISEEKMDRLLSYLSGVSGSGIIYMRSRKKVEQLASYLNQKGTSAEYYHGGLNMKTRMRVQQDWIANKVQVIVCTNAFGMGVDKPDVRFVIHCDIPPSIEEYYQEAGRAGRDGLPATAHTIINYGDITKLQQYHQTSFPKLAFLEEVYRRLCSHLKIGYGSGAGESFDLSLEEFCTKYRYSIARVYSCLAILEKEGWLFMNTAMKKPSMLVFTTSKNNITLSTRNKDLKGRMILHFVRKYEGVFTDFVRIDEGAVANELGVKVDRLVQQLKIMEKESILAYDPSSELPRLTFIMDRPAANSFAIDEVRYKERAKNAHDKMMAIQTYATSANCRQQVILDYFGEQSSACGRCDICAKQKNDHFTMNEKGLLKTHLYKELDGGPILLQEYVHRYEFEKRGKVRAIVKELVSEQSIKIDNNELVSIYTNSNDVN